MPFETQSIMELVGLRADDRKQFLSELAEEIERDILVCAEINQAKEPSVMTSQARSSLVMPI